jgi:hypothetical protein
MRMGNIAGYSLSIQIGEWVHHRFIDGRLLRHQLRLESCRPGTALQERSVQGVADVVSRIKEIMELEARLDREINPPVLAGGDQICAGETSVSEVEGSVGISEASPGPAMR